MNVWPKCFFPSYPCSSVKSCSFIITSNKFCSAWFVWNKALLLFLPLIWGQSPCVQAFVCLIQTQFFFYPLSPIRVSFSVLPPFVSQLVFSFLPLVLNQGFFLVPALFQPKLLPHPTLFWSKPSLFLICPSFALSLESNGFLHSNSSLSPSSRCYFVGKKIRYTITRRFFCRVSLTLNILLMWPMRQMKHKSREIHSGLSASIQGQKAKGFLVHSVAFPPSIALVRADSWTQLQSRHGKGMNKMKHVSYKNKGTSSHVTSNVPRTRVHSSKRIGAVSFGPLMCETVLTKKSTIQWFNENMPLSNWPCHLDGKPELPSEQPMNPISDSGICHVASFQLSRSHISWSDSKSFTSPTSANQRWIIKSQTTNQHGCHRPVSTSPIHWFHSVQTLRPFVVKSNGRKQKIDARDRSPWAIGRHQTPHARKRNTCQGGRNKTPMKYKQSHFLIQKLEILSTLRHFRVVQDWCVHMRCVSYNGCVLTHATFVAV